MPKLKTRRVSAKGRDGTEYGFDTNVYFSEDTNLFTCSFPEELIPRANALHYMYERRKRGRTETFKLTGTSLDEVLQKLENMCRDEVDVKTTFEFVILYRAELEVSFWEGMVGKQIYGNGGMDPAGDRRSEVDGKAAGQGWWAPRTDQKSKSTLYHLDAQRVGIAAKVFRKEIFHRPSGKIIEWCRGGSDWRRADAPDPPDLGLLNSFTIEVLPDDKRLNEIPYSEKAERFFYEMMVGMCEIARRFDGFFGDKDVVAKAIETGQRPKLLT